MAKMPDCISLKTVGHLMLQAAFSLVLRLRLFIQLPIAGRLHVTHLKAYIMLRIWTVCRGECSTEELAGLPPLVPIKLHGKCHFLPPEARIEQSIRFSYLGRLLL